jgi:hypothetical protein
MKSLITTTPPLLSLDDPEISDANTTVSFRNARLERQYPECGAGLTDQRVGTAPLESLNVTHRTPCELANAFSDEEIRDLTASHRCDLVGDIDYVGGNQLEAWPSISFTKTGS